MTKTDIPPYEPRWVNHIFARTHRYFWRSCPRCGAMFGGHEKGGVDWFQEEGQAGEGAMTCPLCPEIRYSVPRKKDV